MEQERPWYKKKRYIIPAGIFTFWALANAFSPAQPQVSTNTSSYLTQQTHAPVQPVKPISSPYNNLSNNNHYTNTYGNTVHSPAYAPSIPANASARCGDGTYSFSQSRRGTCSHHGGVSSWY